MNRQPHIEILDEPIAAILRKKKPAERIALILDANHTARSLAAAGIRHSHPNWDEQQLQAEVARRMLGDTG